MHTLIAYSESQDAAGAEVNVAAVPDQEIRTSLDEVIVPATYNQVIGMLACVGSTGSRAKLVAPSLRRMNPYEQVPLELALFSGGRENYGLHPHSPIPLSVNESLEALLVADPAAAEQQSIVVFLAPGEVNEVKGAVRPIRFSVTVAQTAGTWAFAGLAFIDDLPVGNYDIVGGAMIVAGGVAWRFVPVGGINRPGAPCYQAVSNPQDRMFRGGNLGTWASFDTTQPPSVEILGSAAAASATYYGVMDVVAK